MMKFALIFLSLMLAPLAGVAEDMEDAHMHMMDMDGMEDQSCCEQVCDCPDMFHSVNFFLPVILDDFKLERFSRRVMRLAVIFNAENPDVGHGPPRRFF